MSGHEVSREVAAFLRALGKRVRVLRVWHDLTQEQLAEAASISRSFISVIEQGTHGVDVVRFVRLAAVFGLSLVELLDGTGADVAVRREQDEGLPS
jgi:transcriptional regulator with XRE-family HTH domain